MLSVGTESGRVSTSCDRSCCKMQAAGGDAKGPALLAISEQREAERMTYPVLGEGCQAALRKKLKVLCREDWVERGHFRTVLQEMDTW